MRGTAVEASRSASAFARSMQGNDKFPGIDRFKDIVLKKGTIIYAGFPGCDHFAATPAGTPARLSNALGAARARPGNSLLFDANVEPASRNVGAVLRLADHRSGDLFQL